jgi:hypothetical protein
MPPYAIAGDDKGGRDLVHLLHNAATVLPRWSRRKLRALLACEGRRELAEAAVIAICESQAPLTAFPTRLGAVVKYLEMTDRPPLAKVLPPPPQFQHHA